MIIKGRTSHLPIHKAPEHGCPNCIYLGSFEKHDLWLCKDDIRYGQEYKNEWKIIAKPSLGWCRASTDYVTYHEEHRGAPIYNGWAYFFQKGKEFAQEQGLI